VSFAARSTGRLPAADDAVFLVDTLGELQMFYAASDIAFVAGSLVPIGGHSLLEPAVLGLPMLSGPHTQNGQDVADMLQACGALRIVRSGEELGHSLLQWLDDPQAARAAGAHGRAAVAANRGAVERLVAMIEPLLEVSSSAGPAAPTPAASGSR
jgi:3-deoxy-D-manno-octulosonic-acid transferase